MVVLVSAYPRSGKTLFRIVLNKVFGHKTWTVTNRGDRFYAEVGMDEVVGCADQDRMDDLRAAHSSDELRFVVTQRCTPGGYPAVHVVRDGRDSLVSFARFVEEFEPENATGSFERTLRRLVRERPGRSWAGHVMYWRRRSDATVRFEDLIADPVGEVRRALAAVGLREEPQGEAPTFGELRDLQPRFFRRGIVGSWRDEMPNDLHEEFWERQGMAMEAMGYER